MICHRQLQCVGSSGHQHYRTIAASETVTIATTGRRQVLHTKDDFRTSLFIPVLDRMSSELQRRFAEDTCSIYQGVSALHPESKQFLDEEKISAMATHYQVDLPDLSAELLTAKRLLQRKKISLDGSETAMDRPDGGSASVQTLASPSG